jgi:plastocyanin
MRTRLLVAGVAVVLLSAGCGDDGGDGGGEAATDIEAVATDYAFDPASWTVPAGETVTMTFTNEGDELHEWVIVEQGTTIEASGDFTEDVVVWEIEAEPGASESDEFTAPEPGTYQVICALTGHIEAGMEGTLEVVEAEG